MPLAKAHLDLIAAEVKKCADLKDASGLTQVIDSIFASIETAVGNRPIFIWVLKQANAMIDAYLAAHGL